MARLSLSEARCLALDILSGNGFSERHTAAIADVLMRGQQDGCASHGLYRLLQCVATLKAGKVSPDAEPVISDQAPAIVRVDAGGAFSQLAFQEGLPLVVQKAKDNGLAALAINRCVHFTALWVEIEQITDAGLVAIACNPTQAYVAPAGGRSPLLGTNPFAFGWPRPGRLPYVFDIATSVVARGELELHRRAGKAIPEGWGVDAEGRSSTDPAVVLDEGAMLTFGGYKGTALATMIELLAGPLIGDLTSQESSVEDAGAGALPYHGELLLVLDPKRFLGATADQYLARAEGLFSAIEGQGARLPSQRRYQARAQTLASGTVELPDRLLADLKALLP